MRRSLEAEIGNLRIDASPAVLDEIRMAAVDAFLSLPHGGVEIGGVLFGTRSNNTVRILAARLLECEHALGPTFTLSDKDHARFRELLEAGCGDLEPVGWYHSHTRSEIVISARDLDICNRHFSDPGQLALVVRPHLVNPTRARYFVRDPDGAMRPDTTLGEFILQPGKADTPAMPPEPPPQIPAVPPPAHPRHGRSWQWLWWVAAVLAMAFSAVLFAPAGSSPKRAPFVALSAYDLDGQLQIHWDRTAVPAAPGESARLEIMGGGVATVILLDGQRLPRGTVSYTREHARVDVRFVLEQPDGRKFEDFTTFVGHPPPEAKPDQGSSALQLERDVTEQRRQVRRAQRR